MNSDRLYGLVLPAARWVFRGSARRRREGFRMLPPPDDRVVLYGDSITAHGAWDELLPGVPTANRGIPGDTTADLLARLDDVPARPRAISLLIGTNDLHGGPGEREVTGIAARCARIVGTLRRNHPGVPLVVTGVMPRTALFAARIRELNGHYERLAREHDAAYLDPWPLLADDDGALRPEFTRDHLHLEVPGYLAWSAALGPLLSAGGARGGRA